MPVRYFEWFIRGRSCLRPSNSGCVYIPIKAILHQPRTLPLARYVILSWVESFPHRASALPKIGEDELNSGRISTQGAPETAHYSHSTSVGGMPRGSAESGHARSGGLLGRGGTHARHTPPARVTCSDATFKIFPDKKQRGGGTIVALDASGLQVSSTNIPSISPRVLKCSWSAAVEWITWKDPSDRKGKTFD